MPQVLLFGEPMALFTAMEEGPLAQAERFTRSLAGAEVNVAIGLRRLGHSVAYATRVGDDPLGEYIAGALEREGIGKSDGEKELIRDFTYIFLKSDRVGIVGPNGSGKSTLMKIIAGWVKPDAGQVTVGQTVRMGYFSQENEDMDGSLKVIDYIRNVAEYLPTKDGSVSASQMLERFLFPFSMQYTTISRLSGGERRRLYLLKILMEAPNVILLDVNYSPLNGSVFCA